MILSIDIGIKNLALCIMSRDKKEILLWGVYNVLDDSEPIVCSGEYKNGNKCSRKSIYKYIGDDSELFTCKSHFPKEIPIKRTNKVKIKMVKDYLLQDLVKIFLEKFNKIYTDDLEIFEKVTKIVIELQPKINPKMKLLSHVLFGKLVELYSKLQNVSVRFVAAKNKLKAYKGPKIECTLKNKYSQRKWLGIQYCKWMIKNNFSKEQSDTWLKSIENSPKADDMADTFLMAINCF